MAISAKLDEYLKTLPADTQATLRPLCEANPQLGEGWLRQDEFDRNFNANKTKLEQYDEWKTWADVNIPKHKTVLDENERLQRELETAKAAGGKGFEVQLTDEQFAAKVAEELKKANINPASLSDADLGKLIDPLLTTKAAELEQKFFKETLPNSMAFVQDVVEFGLDFKNEFGEKMDRNAFIQFVAKGGYEKTEDAYKAFTLERRTAKETEKKIEDARREEREKIANQNLPGGQPVGQRGPLVEFITSKSDTKPAGGELPKGLGALGNGEAGRAAAAELVAEGKV